MSDDTADLVITGAGSLATAVTQALALVPRCPLRVSIVARDTGRLKWLVRSSNARRTVLRTPISFRGHGTTWANNDLRELFRQIRPRVVLHTASLQSPWTVRGSDPWSKLVIAAGYGVTLPKQLVLAARAARMLAETNPGGIFVNACYPDAVNAMLMAKGTPVVCGIGNVAILAAFLATELTIPQGELRILAHHAHVSSAISGCEIEGLYGWRLNIPIHDDLRSWVLKAALPSDVKLNAVTGVTAIPLLLSLLGRSAYKGHVPGPLGLQGGYPVYVNRATLQLDLPAAVTAEDAAALNATSACHDGLTIDKLGTARLTDSASRIVAESDAASPLLEPFDAHTCESVVRRLGLEVSA